MKSKFGWLLGLVAGFVVLVLLTPSNQQQVFAQSVKTNGVFGGLLLGGTTNIISDNGTTLTRNGSAISGGGGFAGAVSNSVAQSGLLAVDATKTNGVAATAAMVTGTLGYVPANTNILTTAQKGILTETLLVTNAYYANGHNFVGIDKNQLLTVGTRQYGAYWDLNLKLVVFYRDLSTGALTSNTLTNSLSDGTDEHFNIALSMDSAGYIHIAYGMHDTPLLYIKSTSANSIAAFSGNLSMLGTNETAVTYPMFIVNPHNSELYFTFRSGHANAGDQYFYHYNTNTTTWEAAAGTGVNGWVIGGYSTRSAYLNGLPKWDSSTNLWWSWIWNTTGINHHVIKWTGSAFQAWDGTAQSVPVTATNNTPILVRTPMQVQNDFTIGAHGVTIPYLGADANGNWQAYVLNDTTGSWVNHQLTFVPYFTTNSSIIWPYINAVSDTNYDYVLFPSFGDQDVGIATYQSNDGFATSRKFFLGGNWNPLWAVNPDPGLFGSNRFSFCFMQGIDASYGTNYIDVSYWREPYGKLSVIDWTPSLDVGTSKGVPKDLTGLGLIAGRSLDLTSVKNEPAMTLKAAETGNYVMTMRVNTDGSAGLNLFNTASQATATLADHWYLASGKQIEWSSSATSSTTSPDVGLARDSAGVLRVSNASTGTGILKATSYLLGTNTATADANNSPMWNSLPWQVNRKQYIDITDEHLGPVPTAGNTPVGPFGWVINGVGAGSGVSTLPADAGYPGVWELTCGTTSSGVGNLYNYVAPILFGGGRHILTMIVRLPNLSDGTDTYTIVAGFGDQNGTTNQTDGAYFTYSSANSTSYTNIAKWSGVTASNNARTEVPSSVSVSAATWYALTVDVAADGSSVTFYVNGTSIGSSSTNIPTGAGRYTGFLYAVYKSVGTNARLLDVDMTNWRCDLTTSR